MIRHVELSIITQVIEILLGAGLPITVMSEGETVGRAVNCENTDDIIEDIMAVDESELVTDDGTVYLVLGNNGYDVISDYSESLEELLAPVNEHIDNTYF